MITYEEAVEHFQYDEDMGVLYRKKNYKSGVPRFKPAGTPTTITNRKKLLFKKKWMYNDEVIWLLKTKEWPSGKLRRYNNDFSDDRFCNLDHYIPGGKIPLTLDLLSRYISYDCITGLLTWKKVIPSNNANVGDVVGTISKKGYVKVIFFNGRYQGHRLAWLLYYGALPEKFLDHINGNPSDNRICNLREANYVENACNRIPSKKNTSGVRGVSRLPNDKWQAAVTMNRKTYYVGCFDTIEQAKEAVIKKRSELHGEFANHG